MLSFIDNPYLPNDANIILKELRSTIDNNIFDKIPVVIDELTANLVAGQQIIISASFNTFNQSRISHKAQIDKIIDLSVRLNKKVY